jgi:hypothetical protein
VKITPHQVVVGYVMNVQAYKASGSCFLGNSLWNPG